MQLDLFDWRPPTAEIIAFPADRRIGRIESVARQIIHAKTGAIAERRWHVAINRLRAELITNGFNHAVQTQQIDRMAYAIQQQIQRFSANCEISSSAKLQIKQNVADDKFKFSPTPSKEANGWPCLKF